MTSKVISKSYPKEIDTCSTTSTQLTASDLSVTTGSVDADCETNTSNITDEESVIPPPVCNGLKRQDNFVALQIPGAFAVSSPFNNFMTFGQENRSNRDRTTPHQDWNVVASNLPTVEAELVVNTKIPHAEPSIAKAIPCQHSQSPNYTAKTEDKPTWKQYLCISIVVSLLILAIVVAVTTIAILNRSTASFKQNSKMAAEYVDCTTDRSDFQYNRTNDYSTDRHIGGPERSGRFGKDSSSRSGKDSSSRSGKDSHRSDISDRRSHTNCRRRQHHSQ